ncbi:subtilase-type protease inhibitor [Rhizohabitans arisaemae]|uniref:subtilase-type protease inhibitor n=1 Tax=Rhizohabitans arisaemae TaxID=2720610 RepID=UPI0024B1C6D8|nr:subtilase-type protease inhibitor [Rhizohabitans arisaemae]
MRTAPLRSIGVALLTGAALTFTTTAAVAAVHPEPPVKESKIRLKALILTIANGESPVPAERVALLFCDPPRGTHPAASRACAQLNQVNGDPAELDVDPGAICPLIYAPVTVTATGVWQQSLVRFERTYGNSCQLRAKTGRVFAF